MMLVGNMSVSQLMEMITGKASCCLGGIGDGTAFTDRDGKQINDMVGKILTENNYHCTGNELFYNGCNGKRIESKVYIGISYYVVESTTSTHVACLNEGGRNILTRQPIGFGSQELTELDTMGLVGHGASVFLTESVMDRSDGYSTNICNKTGFITSSREQSERTSFPTSWKLLIQELQAINIQPRLITESNIHTLRNLCGKGEKEVNEWIQKSMYANPYLGNGKHDIKGILYGWVPGYEESKKKRFWTNVETRDVVYREPKKLKIYRELLKRSMTVPGNKYLQGDLIYYLGDVDERKKPTNDPSKEWTILSIEEGGERMTISSETYGILEKQQNVVINPTWMRLISRMKPISISDTTRVEFKQKDSNELENIHLEQAIGEIIYGWKKKESSLGPYWEDTTETRKGLSTWEEPSELSMRREILQLALSKQVFSVGNVFYNLTEWEEDRHLPTMIVHVEDISRKYVVLKVSYDDHIHVYQMTCKVDGTDDTSPKMLILFQPQYMRLLTQTTSIQNQNESKDKNTINNSANLQNTRIGGGVDTDFYINQKIYWKPDIKKRIWIIRKLSSETPKTEDGFKIEIITEDHENLEFEDRIKHVSPDEIESIPNEELFSTPTQETNSFDPMNFGNGRIVVAPIIKVINGDDNSQSNGNETTPSGPTQIPFSYQNSPIDKKENSLKFKEDSIKIKKEEKQRGGFGGTMMNTLANVTDFIVKKLT